VVGPVTRRAVHGMSLSWRGSCRRIGSPIDADVRQLQSGAAWPASNIAGVVLTPVGVHDSTGPPLDHERLVLGLEHCSPGIFKLGLPVACVGLGTDHGRVAAGYWAKPRCCR